MWSAAVLLPLLRSTVSPTTSRKAQPVAQACLSGVRGPCPNAPARTQPTISGPSPSMGNPSLTHH